jgi:hypothetical protein
MRESYVQSYTSGTRVTVGMGTWICMQCQEGDTLGNSPLRLRLRKSMFW